jgi:mRNA interferase HigB
MPAIAAHQHARSGAWPPPTCSDVGAGHARDLRVFASADNVEGLTVFDIGGNKFRLITSIHYNRRKVYIRAVLTHAEYDRGNWKRPQ